MRKNILCLVIFISIVFLLNPFSILWAETNIQNITLQREGDYTKLTISGDAPFQFNHFIEEKKEGKPYRIVVDCLNAINSLPQLNFSEIPTGMISGIRTSQYQVSPDKVCRIVLDLKSPVVYKVIEEPGNKAVTLALSTPQEPVYPLWSAVSKSLPQKEGKSDSKPSGLAQAKPDIKANPVEKSRTVLASEEKPVKKDQVEKKKEVKVAQKPEATPPMKSQPPTKPASEVKKEEEKGALVKEETKITPPEKTEQAEELTEIDTLEKEPPAGMTGKLIEEVPKRRLLVYHSGERKDPFSPLSEKKNFMMLGTAPLPGIEELKLVGILENPNGFKALLENELGYGYILQPGDRIRNGSVVSIDKERVIFQIQEYGFTKNIALELFTPNQEER